jgi:hypothetical protein
MLTVCKNARIGEGWQRKEMFRGGESKRPRPRLGCSAIGQDIDLHNVTSQKTAIIIATALGISRLTKSFAYLAFILYSYYSVSAVFLSPPRVSNSNSRDKLN